ncbi:hypothetical protein D4100_02290 [Serratia inhibens]|uniref:Uncharacterized protein n=1 Tax=Serratia inhibens TaxID=2338073 RepID=A0AA92X5N8_9GAMM|nr:hypothetical protein [Serratia inhibens]RJF57635.1 hypothetical protein D4100_02290 [Serratia inhibens]
MTDSLNPQQGLQNFFLLDRAFAFHDQTLPSECYTYGSAAPQSVLDTPSGKVSALHLLTSPGGGLATFIAPNMPVDTAAIESYIRQHFIPAPGKISLAQGDVRQSLFLRFVHQPESDSYNVEFEQSKMPLTHAEAGLLDNAIRGAKNQVYLVTHSQFSVSSRVAARLDTDWVAFLTLAFNEQARQPEAIALLLNQQIDAGVISLLEQFDNAPSEQTRELVRNALVKTAAQLVSNTLRNIHSVDEIPNKLSYDVSYSNSVSQRYLLAQQQDIATLLGQLPADSIITFTSTPLPEPSRPDKPIEHRQCVVSLGFNPNGFNIMSIELRWADQQTPMQWPSFPPVTLKTESAVDSITLKVTFSDYSSYERQFGWLDAVALTPQDLGFYSVIFEAEHLKPEFKTISGNATYRPAGQVKSQSFSFAFSNQQWQANWWINAHAAGLNGRIEYRWQGKTSSLFPKTYDSGPQQASTSPIKLQYNK